MSSDGTIDTRALGVRNRRRRAARRSGLPRPFWAVVGGSVLLGLATTNALLSAAAAGLLGALVYLTWRPNEPPILVLAMGFQWLQVVMKIIQADLRGVPVAALSFRGGDLETALWLSMASLLALALGVRIVLQGMPSHTAVLARVEALLLSTRRVFWAYVAFAVVGVAAPVIAWRYPQLTQPLLKVADLKWVFFFLLAYVSFVKRRDYTLLALAFGIELVSGFGGFFGAFKTAFFVLIIAYAAAILRWRWRNMLMIGGVVCALFLLGLVWTAVKIDYRDYVNQGQRDQVIRVDLGDRYARLFTLATGLERAELSQALKDLGDRIAYVDYFSRVVVVVPDVLPHEDGALWFGALQHIAMPRLLFPDKAVRPLDTDLTARYTGLDMRAAGRGTSISMGYAAETYIDFGVPLMFFALFALGLVWGWIYRFLLAGPRSLLVLNYGLVIAVLLPLYQFEINNVKLLGGVIMSFLVAVLVQRLLFPRILAHLWQRRPASPKRVSRAGDTLVQRSVDPPPGRVAPEANVSD